MSVTSYDELKRQGSYLYGGCYFQAMGQVFLIFLLVDHVREPGSKVRVDKGVVFQFELEAPVETNVRG